MPPLDTDTPRVWLRTTGDLLHFLEIIVLLVSVGITYEKFDHATQMVKAHAEQLNRIEHYLSSKDTQYWKLSREAQ